MRSMKLRFLVAQNQTLGKPNPFPSEFGIHLQSHVHVICQANFRFEFPIDFRPRTALDNWENMFSTHVLLFFFLSYLVMIGFHSFSCSARTPPQPNMFIFKTMLLVPHPNLGIVDGQVLARFRHYSKILLPTGF